MIKKRIAVCNKCKKVYKFEEVHGEIKNPMTCQCGMPLLERRKGEVRPAASVSIIIDDQQFTNHISEITRRKGALTYPVHMDDKSAFKTKGRYVVWYEALLSYNSKHGEEFASVRDLLEYLYIEKNKHASDLPKLLGIDVGEPTMKSVLRNLDIRKKAA